MSQSIISIQLRIQQNFRSFKTSFVNIGKCLMLIFFTPIPFRLLKRVSDFIFQINGHLLAKQRLTTKIKVIKCNIQRGGADISYIRKNIAVILVIIGVYEDKFTDLSILEYDPILKISLVFIHVEV